MWTQAPKELHRKWCISNITCLLAQICQIWSHLLVSHITTHSNGWFLGQPLIEPLSETLAIEATQLSELLRFCVTDILPSHDVVQRVIPYIEQCNVHEWTWMNQASSHEFEYVFIVFNVIISLPVRSDMSNMGDFVQWLGLGYLSRAFTWMTSFGYMEFRTKRSDAIPVRRRGFANFHWRLSNYQTV